MESDSIELLHSIQLDMLVKFDKICGENGLTYFLDSGTALGAVRHHGFIPWDDDVDVGMPREDYNRLLELGSNGCLQDNLFLQTYKTDSAYPWPFAKVRLGDTFFPDFGVEKMKYKGIYIDIFPYDKVPSNTKRAVWRIKVSRLFWFISIFSRRDYPGSNFFSKILTAVLHVMPKGIGVMLHRFYERYCIKFNSKDTEVYTCYSWNMSQYHTYLFEESELFPTKKVSFEGKSLCIVNNPDAYLTKMYGDYLVLPPEEKRKSHLKGAFVV